MAEIRPRGGWLESKPKRPAMRPSTLAGRMGARRGASCVSQKIGFARLGLERTCANQGSAR